MKTHQHDSSKCAIFQQVAFDGPEYITNWLEQNGYTCHTAKFYQAGFALSEIHDVNTIIISGGPTGVHDDSEYPWLHREKDFIEDCINTGGKMSGICLGAQFVDTCMGTRECTATDKDIGWFPVLSDECREISRSHELFEEQPVVLHWHGDKFDIPYDGSLNILSPHINSSRYLLKVAISMHYNFTWK